MSQPVKDWQGLLKVIITIGTLLVGVTLGYANLKSDIRSLRESQSHYNRTIEEIKQMFQLEVDRHHPRKP